MKLTSKVSILLLVMLASKANAASLLAYTPYRETPAALIQRHCVKANSTPQIESCTSKALAALDAELNRTYQRILDSLASVDVNQEKKDLVAEQRAWLKLRDASAQTEYQANILGTIRGVSALTRKVTDTHYRTQMLKRRYLSLFNEEFSLADLVGEWRGIFGTKRVLRIAVDGKCSLEDPGVPKKSGTCARDGISLKIVDSSGKTVFEEWIYVETISIGGADSLVLQLLRGAGATTEALIKE